MFSDPRLLKIQEIVYKHGWKSIKKYAETKWRAICEESMHIKFKFKSLSILTEEVIDYKW